MMRISGIEYSYRKTKTLRNVILFFIILLLLGGIAIAIISVYTAWSLLHPPKEDLPTFSSNIVPENKEVEFFDIHGKMKLKGQLFKTKGSEKVVIVAHGYKKNRFMYGEKTLDLVKGLLQQEYCVFLFDFRNAGDSGGKITTIGIEEKDDLLGAVNYVRSQGMKHISLLGFSMGAAASLTAAAEDQEVDAVIADSSFADLSEYLNQNLSAWSGLPSFPFNQTILFAAKIIAGVDPSKMSPEKSMEKILPRPVLFIHSKDDLSIPVEDSRRMYETYIKMKGSSVFWETAGFDHVQSFPNLKEEYIDKVIGFLDGVYAEKKAKALQ